MQRAGGMAAAGGVAGGASRHGSGEGRIWEDNGKGIKVDMTVFWECAETHIRKDHSDSAGELL